MVRVRVTVTVRLRVRIGVRVRVIGLGLGLGLGLGPGLGSGGLGLGFGLRSGLVSGLELGLAMWRFDIGYIYICPYALLMTTHIPISVIFFLTRCLSVCLYVRKNSTKAYEIMYETAVQKVFMPNNHCHV
jgi:hypothetical protein